MSEVNNKSSEDGEFAKILAASKNRLLTAEEIERLRVLCGLAPNGETNEE